MPIGVPRIIYCWGEELPAQWTDIYNFIFRRRMVFLMQYLDDELCNQICGLLINIHMEDRAKEFEKKETENSGLFKGQKKTIAQVNSNLQNKSVEDLLKSEDDLAIDESHRLEQYTLQKITLEWLNWNSQFFDYADEPYLFYLTDILSKSFTDTKQDARLLYSQWRTTGPSAPRGAGHSAQVNSFSSHFDVYSPFRIFSDISSNDDLSYGPMELKNQKDFISNTSLGPSAPRGAGNSPNKKMQDFGFMEKLKQRSGSYRTPTNVGVPSLQPQKIRLGSVVSHLANKELWEKIESTQTAEKALGQRRLRKEYTQQRTIKNAQALHLINPTVQQLLDFDSSEGNYNEFRDYYRKQTERAFQDEESKKVYMLINSFGGSVGNGITVHDALQFIKAGSLTLALGVAASAASLALAGGTIGERYVTEGCHTMIHQPECLTSDHSVLTDEGWLPISQVTKKQKVATLNKKNEITYEYPIAVHKKAYKGPLYIIKTPDVDLAVTTNHRMYVDMSQQHTDVCTNQTDSNNMSFELVEASSILNKKVRYKKDGEWVSTDYQFILPSIEIGLNCGKIQKVPEVIVPMESWLLFFGAWISEGMEMASLTPYIEEAPEGLAPRVKVPASSAMRVPPTHATPRLRRTKSLQVNMTSDGCVATQPRIQEPCAVLKKSEMSKAFYLHEHAPTSRNVSKRDNRNSRITPAHSVHQLAPKVHVQGQCQGLFSTYGSLAPIKLASVWQKHPNGVGDATNSAPIGVEKKIALAPKVHGPGNPLETALTELQKYVTLNSQLWSYLKPLSLKKRLPCWVWNLSKAQCNILLKALQPRQVEQSKNTPTEFERQTVRTQSLHTSMCTSGARMDASYRTTSEDLALDICRLIVHAGFSFYIQCIEDKNTLDASLINSQDKFWRVNILSSNQPYVNYDSKSSNDLIQNDYDGYVYCLTVPNNVFYVQHNGIPSWSGNSQLSGQASDIWIDSQEILKIRQEVANIYSLSTYRPRHKILRDLDRDFYLTATETIYYGLADEIASNEVMREIIKMTSKVWDYHDTKQQRLLESRDNLTSGAETQTQN